MRTKGRAVRVLAAADCLIVDIARGNEEKHRLGATVERSWPGDPSEVVALRLGRGQALLARSQALESSAQAGAAVYALPLLGPPRGDPYLRLREESGTVEWAAFHGGRWESGSIGGPSDGSSDGQPPPAVPGGYRDMDLLCARGGEFVFDDIAASVGSPSARLRRRHPERVLSPFARPFPDRLRGIRMRRFLSLAALCLGLLLLDGSLGRIALAFSSGGLGRATALSSWRRATELTTGGLVEGATSDDASIPSKLAELSSALSAATAMDLALEELLVDAEGFRCSGACRDGLALARALEASPAISAARILSLGHSPEGESFMIKGRFND